MSDAAGSAPATVAVDPASLRCPPHASFASERLLGHHPGLSRVIHVLWPPVVAAGFAAALVFMSPLAVSAFLVEQADVGVAGRMHVVRCTISRYTTDCYGDLLLDGAPGSVPVRGRTMDASTADEGRTLRVRAWDSGSTDVYLAGGDSWVLYGLAVCAALVLAPLTAVMGVLRLRFAVGGLGRARLTQGAPIRRTRSARLIRPASARAARPWVEWSLIATGAVVGLLAVLTLAMAVQALTDPDLGRLSEDFLGPALSTTVLAPVAAALVAEGALRLLRLRRRGTVWDLGAGPAACRALPTATSMLLGTRWVLPVGAFLVVGFIGSEPSWPAVIVAAVTLLLAGYEVAAARRHRARLDTAGLALVDPDRTHRVPWSEVVGLAQDDEHGYLVALTGDRCISVERLLAHTARNEPLLWTVARRAAAAETQGRAHAPVPSDDDVLLRMRGLWTYVGIGSLAYAALPLLWIAVDVVSVLRGRLSAGSVVVTAALVLLLVALPSARPLIAAGRHGIGGAQRGHRLGSWLRLGTGLVLCAGALAYCALLVGGSFR